MAGKSKETKDVLKTDLEARFLHLLLQLGGAVASDMAEEYVST